MINDDFYNFYLSKEQPIKSCLLVLRDIILKQDERVTETRKYGMPCFCYQKKMFCFLWTDKITAKPCILFVEGKHLDHPSLKTENRTRTKILPVDPHIDLPIKTIELLLTKALDLYRNGIVKIKA